MKKFKNFRKREDIDSLEDGFKRERGSKRKKLKHELRKFKKHVNLLLSEIEYTQG